MLASRAKAVGLNGRRQRGFTLIEVATVVTILGILAAIALPIYTQYVARGHRSEARGTLLAAAQWMERWRTERGTYLNAALPGTLNRSPPTGAQRYTITLATPAANQFLLTATPMGTMLGDECGNLTLDGTGARNSTGPANIDLCWGR